MSLANNAHHPGLHIAIVLSELRAGGMERVVVHLAKGLVAHGVATLVVCLQNPGDLASEFEGSAVQVEALHSLTGRDFHALWRLRSLLRNFRPSIINLHDYASSPYVVAANWLSGRVPLMFTAHGLLYAGFENLRSRYRFFSKSFSAVTAVSEEVAMRHREYLAWSGNIPIIKNGVPAVQCEEQLRSKVRNELGINSDCTLFLAVGNPRPEKGFEDLIDAVALLRDSPEITGRFFVAIAGKMTDSDYCRMLTKRAQGLSGHCRILGFRNDTAALYSAADVFVLSSRSEGLPMVILEAMMAGLPVIATKVGGVPDAVSDRGILVNSAKPAELAAAMRTLLDETGLAERLGQSGQEYTRSTYGVDRMVDDYLACYQKLAAGGERT